MIAVLGARGQLGSAFVRLLGEKALAVDRSHLDLSLLDSIPPWIEANRPELVINCAAYTAVDAAESDIDTAHLVNARAVGRLAEVTGRHGIGLVTFSTDYVFDGEKTEPYLESDSPNPLNVYGRTKLEGERLAQESNPETLVIRTSWVLSETHANFASRILSKIPHGSVKVVDDQRGRPTIADDLAHATLQATSVGAAGVLHLANEGQTTWHRLAQELAVIAGFDPATVLPCSSFEFPRPARRPRNSVLNSQRLVDLGLDPMPQYRPGLERIVRSVVSQTGIERSE